MGIEILSSQLTGLVFVPSCKTAGLGELGKLAVVHEGILHKCIQQLLEKKRGLNLTDQAEDLECLCQIMKTVGKRLDTSKAKVSMETQS